MALIIAKVSLANFQRVHLMALLQMDCRLTLKVLLRVGAVRPVQASADRRQLGEVVAPLDVHCMVGDESAMGFSHGRQVRLPAEHAGIDFLAQLQVVGHFVDHLLAHVIRFLESLDLDIQPLDISVATFDLNLRGPHHFFQ